MFPNFMEGKKQINKTDESRQSSPSQAWLVIEITEILNAKNVSNKLKTLKGEELAKNANI